VTVNATRDEPVIPPRLRWPLAAMWISIALHGALIVLVQVAPPNATSLGDSVIEARLVSPRPAETAVEIPLPLPEAETQPVAKHEPPRLAPSETVEALPVAASPDVPPSAPPQTAEPAVPEPVVPAAPAPAAVSMPAMTMTSPVDLTYYSARDLDVQPRSLRKIVPDYPPDADRQQLSGRVILQLSLEADGRVSDIKLVSATPPGMFEHSATRAFRDARFAPARKGGRSVRARVLIEVVYDWEGRR
jgi:protein TonB